MAGASWAGWKRQRSQKLGSEDCWAGHWEMSCQAESSNLGLDQSGADEPDVSGAEFSPALKTHSCAEMVMSDWLAAEFGATSNSAPMSPSIQSPFQSKVSVTNRFHSRWEHGETSKPTIDSWAA
jgi:hypothetical protein